MSESMQKAARLISGVQISSVRLLEVAGRTGIRSAGDVEQVRLIIQHSARVPHPPDAGILYVHASFDLEVLADEMKTPAVTLKATFELKYNLPEDLGDATSEELAAFAETNAVFNAWPYWREFIQSTLVRMNLPPILLPVFRLSDHVAANEGPSARADARQLARGSK